MSIVSIIDVPGAIAGSPVSPTLVRPLASSSKRFGSPSKVTIGKSAAIVSVCKRHELVVFLPVVRDDERDLARRGVGLGQVDEHVGGVGLTQGGRDRGRVLRGHAEVLVHPHRVVALQVADHRVVTLGHVDREHHRLAGSHVTGLPEVRHTGRVLVDPVRLALEGHDREVRSHRLGLQGRRTRASPCRCSSR